MADRSVRAILSAKDENFTSTFEKAMGKVDTFSQKLSSGIGFGILTGVGQQAFSALSRAAAGFASELQQTGAAWKTFESNATMNGRTEADIKSTRKELQKFAQQTIYSSSDMATTFAQLDAVGIASATDLVKGFGGIAAAAENPSQAMKTLSQQGVQMAAKPTVAWQDFKLMLEQTPAGIAAVAKSMGMTTKELVTAVQDGSVATEDFFKAIIETGNSADFTKLATSYKTAGQAMDGLSETLTNTLQPAFDTVQDIAIGGIERVIDLVGKIDADDLAQGMRSITDALSSGDIGGALNTVLNGLDKLPEGFKMAGAAAGAMGAAVLGSQIFDAGGKIWSIAGEGAEKAGAHLQKMAAKGKKAFSDLGNGAKRLPKMLSGISDIGTKVGDAFEAFKDNSLLGDLKKLPWFQKLEGAFGKMSGVAGKAVSKTLGVFGKMGSGLNKMMGLALKALMPAALIGVALAGFGLLYSTFGDQIDGILQVARTKGPEIITNLTNGIASRIPELVSKGADLVKGLLTTLTANLPAIIAGGANIITSLVQGVSSALPTLVPTAAHTVMTLVTSIISQIPSLITTGLELLQGLAQGIVNSMPVLISKGTEAVTSFIDGMSERFPTILSTAASIITTLVGGLAANLPALITGAVSCISSLASGFLQNLPMIITTGIQLIGALAEGIATAFVTLVSNIPTLFGQLVDAIMGVDWLAVGSQILQAIGEGITGGFSWIGEKIGAVFGGGGGQIEAQEGGQQSGQAYVTSTTQAITAGTGDVSAATNLLGLSGAQGLATGVSDGLSGLDLTSILTTPFDAAGSEMSASTTALTSDISSVFSSGASDWQNAVQTGMNGVTTALTQGGTRSVAIAKTTGTQVTTAFKAAVPGATSAGRYIGIGLANGMQSQLGRVRSIAAQLAAAANKAIEAKAKIGSPSKVTTQYGAWYGEGFVNGIEGMVRQARMASEDLVNIPNALGFGGFGGDWNINADPEMYDRPVIVYTTMDVDGRQFATATADSRDRVDARRARNRSRKVGFA